MDTAVGISVGRTNFVAICTHQPVLICPTPQFLSTTDIDISLLAAALIDFANIQQQRLSLTVTIPAYWDLLMVDKLRSALLDQLPATFPLIMTDAMATFTALQTQALVPQQGLLVMCDIGGSGTDITILDIAKGGNALADTCHYQGFSGSSIDHILAKRILHQTHSNPDPAIVHQCRIAKEHYITEKSDSIVPLHNDPYGNSFAPIPSQDLYELFAQPLTTLISTINNYLDDTSIASERCSALVLTGGGTLLPHIQQILAHQLSFPIISAPYPHLISAMGAFLLAGGNIDHIDPTHTQIVSSSIPEPSSLPTHPTTEFNLTTPHHHRSQASTLHQPWYKRWRSSH